MIKRFSLYFVMILLLAACAGNGKNMSCNNPAKGYYCVQSGDTLYRIGQRFGTNVLQLKQWNNLKSNRILAGQVLQVSSKAKTQNFTAQQNNKPLLMPVNGSIIKPFSPSTRGIDIAAPLGTPVKAAADGVVIYAGEEVRGYGKLLLVRHTPTLLTAYANNDILLVGNQARVKAGQSIATVGNSSRLDGATALHFEVRVNGAAVNPQLYLK